MNDSWQTKLDMDRSQRLGMIEAIWGEHKTAEQIAEILEILQKAGQLAFVTRVDRNKAVFLKKIFQSAEFHSQARCLTLGKSEEFQPSLGEVLVLSGGTSDLVVAAEAELALRLHGIKTELILDVGVSGIHRLIDRLNRIKKLML